MARNQTKRLKPLVLQADESVFSALHSINSYRPANSAYSIDAVRTARIDMEECRRVEAIAIEAAASARVTVIAKEWEFHNLMLGVKTQVIAQFGIDSDELKALGRKKRSEYKAPGRRAKVS